ncbi:hypothetical protein D3C78_995230 [compost metagenome]
MRQVGRFAALFGCRCGNPADLVEISFAIGRPGCAVLVTNLPGNGPHALMEDEGLFLFEGGLDGFPAHGGIVDRRDALLGVALIPAERLHHFRLGEDKLAGLFVHELHAIGLKHHQIVDTDIRAMQHAILSGLAVDHFLRQRGQIIEREFTGIDLGRQAFDKGLVLADLAQHVLVVEEHADFRVLWNTVNLAVGALGRIPEDRKNIAIDPRGGGDPVFHRHGITVLRELANPFMRQNVDIRALPHRKCLQRIESETVPALHAAIVRVDDDALVDAGGLELRVHDAGRRFNVGDAGGRILVGERPEFDVDVFGKGNGRQKCADGDRGRQGKRFKHEVHSR